MLALSGCTPAGPRALLDGKRRIEQKRYAQAIQALRTATTLLSTNAQAWNYLGLAYHYAGDPGEAQKAYEQALALDRDLNEAHYNLGCLLLEQNKTNSARNELTTFTLRRPNHLEGCLKLGLAQLRARDWMGAEKCFNDALRLNARHPAALNGLGVARVQRGRSSEGAQLFSAALKAEPGYPPALLNLAIVNQQYLKDKPAALRAYQAYLTSQPNNSDAVRSTIRQLSQELAAPARPSSPAPSLIATAAPPPRAASPETVQVATTTPPKAEEAARPKPVAAAPAPAPPTPSDYEVVRVPEALDIKPAQDIPGAPRDTLAEPVRTASGERADEKAPKRGLLQRVNPLNLFRSDSKAVPGSTTNAAEPISSEPIPETANAGVSRYVYKSPPKPAAGNRSAAQPWFTRGVQAQQSYQLTEAAQAYTRALQSDPSFFEAQYNAALVNAQAVKVAAALEAYERALAIKPESVDARYNFALLLKQSEFYLDAAHEFARILASHPQEARAHLALGNLYAQQLREPTKARSHYLKVLELEPGHPQAGAINFWLSSNP